MILHYFQRTRDLVFTIRGTNSPGVSIQTLPHPSIPKSSSRTNVRHCVPGKPTASVQASITAYPKIFGFCSARLINSLRTLASWIGGRPALGLSSKSLGVLRKNGMEWNRWSPTAGICTTITGHQGHILQAGKDGLHVAEEYS